MSLRLSFIHAVIGLGLLMGACRQHPTVLKDYGRPLPRGVRALRKITDPTQYPNLEAAWAAAAGGSLTHALNRSLAWFEKPSTRQHFPIAGVTHGHARASIRAFGQILESSASASQFEHRFFEEFDVYTSVGWDGSGMVLFTGYFSPVFAASWQRTHEYRYPLYQRPPDLVTDPQTGKTLGRRVGNLTISYPRRAKIEQERILEGQELVWLKDKLDAYLIQVNGSAKVILTDGNPLFVGYAGNNGHEYTSIGKLLVNDGKIERGRISLKTIRQFFGQHPGQTDHYLQQNDRFVFFQQYPSAQWPAGSLGFKVTPFRSLATDKDVFPRGCVTMVQTRLPQTGGTNRNFEQFMLDQDTGGAIRAAGRADIYMGVGPKAEQLAGQQAEEGRLYYFFLKPGRLEDWTDGPAPPVAAVQ